MFFEQTRIFQEGLSKRHVFSRRFYLFVEQTLLSHRTDINISQKPLFSPQTHTNFPGASIFSSNRYSFSRKPYLVLEHLRFSRRPYLVLEHIGIFQEPPMPRTHRHFPGRYPLSNRYFANRSRWLLSINRWTVNSLMSVLTNIKENNYLCHHPVAAVYSTFQFKKSTQERHYIFVGSKLQINSHKPNVTMQVYIK